jgi:biotin carboxylase
MAETRCITFLCLASEHKGDGFMREAKRQGCRIIMVAAEKLKNDSWPWESIDEKHFLPDMTKTQDILNGVSYLARGQHFDRIIPMDEYDVENAATLREHLILPGVSHDVVRRFRDKLAMRAVTQAGGVRVPEFVGVVNYDELREFMNRVAPPWMLKPRLWAGSIGMKKIHEPEELWRTLDKLGDEQSYYLLEQFVPGDVFHVDSLVWKGKIAFSIAHQYGQPPFTVAHQGGVFMTRTMKREAKDTKALMAFNKKVLAVMGLEHGAAHAEYIKSHADGGLYFLEVAARVGGANITELIEAATGLNMWGEIARMEIADIKGEVYDLPELRNNYAGILICLARQEHPDLSSYSDPEIVWRMRKPQHAGLIVASSDYARVGALLDEYSHRFANDFLAVAQPYERPPL